MNSWTNSPWLLASLEQAGEEIYTHITKTVAPDMPRVELRRLDGPSQTTFTAIFE